MSASTLEEGSLGGGGLNGQLGDHTRTAILGNVLDGIQIVPPRRSDGIEANNAVNGRAADLPLLLLATALSGTERYGISACPSPACPSPALPVRGPSRRPRGPLPPSRHHDSLLRRLGPLPGLGNLGNLLQLGLGLRLNSIGEEVREVLEQVGVVGEQGRHLVQNVLDAPLLLLVRVKDFQELLVRLRLGREALLDGGNVVDGMIEFDRRLRRPPSSAALLLLLLKRRAHLLLHVRWRTTRRRTERWTPWRSLAARPRPLSLLLISRRHTPRRTARRSPLLLPLLRPTPHVRGHSARRSTGERSSLRRRRTGRSRTTHATLPRSKDVRNARLAGTAINGKDLTGLVRRKLDLVPLGEEGVEAQNEVLVALEQVGYTADDARGVDLLRFERLHDVEELVVYVRTLAELHLDLIQVHEGVLDAQFAHHGCGLLISVKVAGS